MSSLARTFDVLRLTLRLDRVWLVAWLVICVVFAVFFIPIIPSLVTDDQMMQVLQQTMGSPAVVAMCGMIYGDSYTFGIMYTQMMFVFSALLIALMNILLVNRHTRSDEELGRLELISALPVGRAAPLTSITLIVVVANVVIACAIAVIMPLFGLETIDFAGSLVFGAALGSIGLIFAALTMLFAQLTATAKGTMGFSLAMLGVCYVLRAAGDMGENAADNPLGFASPLGLGERTYPYYDNLWWPICVMVGVAAVIMIVAFALNARRDHGVGMLPSQTGRAHAGSLMRGQFSLAVRLTRSLIIAWAVVIFILSASYGSVFNEMDAFYTGNELIQAMMGLTGSSENILEPIIHTLVMIMSILAVIPVGMVVNHLRSEERRGRLELIYSTATSRVLTLVSYALIAAIAAVLFQLLTACGMWASQAASMSDAVPLDTFLKAAVNALPAVLVFEGLAIFLLGISTRLSPVLWFYLAYSFYVVYVGGAFDIPEWMTLLSPFGMLSSYPAEPFDPIPWCALWAAFVALSAAGIAAYRLRDMR